MTDFETRFIKFLHEKKRSRRDRAFFNFLKALSYLFLAGWWIRKTLLRLLPKRRLACPVISVGNITTGGTGKTPIVISLARHFVSKGKKVAILSRGYGRTRQTSGVLWVSDGRKILASAEEGGDEPVLIARSVPKAAVLVCKNRYRAGQEVLERFIPDLIILDDGFQRRFGLHRDLELVVIDGANPFSNGSVLPAGLLREPLGALSDADGFILNKVNLSRDRQEILKVLAGRNPKAFVVESLYKPIGLKDLRTGKGVIASSLNKVSVGAFSGLANPDSFLRTLAEQKIRVRHSYPLRDHFNYTREKLRAILEDAKLRGLQVLITTQKDAVKLPAGLESEIPILVLEIKWEIVHGADIWASALKNIPLASLAEKKF